MTIAQHRQTLHPTLCNTASASNADACNRTHAFSEAARRRIERTEGTPLFINDWVRTVFLHYEVKPEVLQPLVPYELDLRGSKAYVSMVAFTMQRLRPYVGGRITEWLSTPLSNHGFLNARTYVKHKDEPGIFFLAEWVPNPVSVFIGNRTFGLPYRLGHQFYRHNHERGNLHGQVTAAPTEEQNTPSYRYSATLNTGEPFAPCPQVSLSEWLLERYTAYTERRGVQRRFRIWHEPWEQVPINASIEDESLLETTGPWLEEASFIGANYSPGVIDVWVGRPQCINGRFTSHAWDMNV